MKNETLPRCEYHPVPCFLCPAVVDGVGGLDRHVAIFHPELYQEMLNRLSLQDTDYAERAWLRTRTDMGPVFSDLY